MGRAYTHTHQGDEKRHDVERLDPSRADDAIAQRLAVEHPGREEDENGDERDSDEIEVDVAPLARRRGVRMPVWLWCDSEDGQCASRCFQDEGGDWDTEGEDDSDICAGVCSMSGYMRERRCKDVLESKKRTRVRIACQLPTDVDDASLAVRPC